jgi:hypothetical protein
MGNPEPNPLFRKQTKFSKARIKKDRCRDSTEAILKFKNRFYCVALVNKPFPQNSRKDKPIYIRIRTEILFQMINDDPNLYYLSKK